MTSFSFEINLGHLLTLLSIGVSFYAIHRGRKKEARELAESMRVRARELADSVRQRAEELAEGVQTRHIENVRALTELKTKIERLDHLDECIDKLKDQIRDWIMDSRR